MSTWVLLRGLMRDSRHWGDFPQRLQQAMPTHKVITLDFPGNGHLHAETSPANVADMVAHARAQLTRLGYAPPYRILALSLGAMVAVAWSEMHAGELEKMILINTSLAPYNPFYQRLRPQNYAAVLRLPFASIPQRERLILGVTSNRSHTENMDTILQQWISYARAYPVTRGNMLRQLIAAMRFHAAPNAPAVPVLLLTGQQDQLVSSQCTLTLARLWHCAVRIHPAAGHDLPLDDGDWVVAQICAWLDSA